MREVGVFEAKNKLGQLLDLVEHCEEVKITRHGKGVARLVPVRHSVNRQAARTALQRFRTRARGAQGRFDWSDWKTCRDEGRP